MRLGKNNIAYLKLHYKEYFPDMDGVYSPAYKTEPVYILEYMKDNLVKVKFVREDFTILVDKKDLTANSEEVGADWGPDNSPRSERIVNG